ncbi:MAG: hypothetical protein LIO41_00495 [Ruminococcus sp.]|nr:hypothetical protein [Ruminococcus sp.]
MKKLLSIILALALTASFVACDSDDDTDVKMPDVSSESEALTYEEAIEPFVASEEIQTLQQKQTSFMFILSALSLTIAAGIRIQLLTTTALLLPQRTAFPTT